MINSIGTINVDALFGRYEENLNDSYTWQIGMIGGFMSLIAITALMSFILRKI